MQATPSTSTAEVQDLGSVQALARLDGLAACQALTDQVCARLSLDAEDTYAVRLAVEEACTNVVSHGYKGQAPGPLSVHFTLLGQQHLQARIHDRAPPFHPDLAPTPDLGTNVTERAVGGLGWMLIRQMMPPVAYRSDASGNTLVLQRNLRHPVQLPRP